MVWEAQAVGEELLPAALHSWPMQSCHGSWCWCIMCEGSCWEERKNQASSMGSSLAYACLKQKIWAASAQAASEHLSCSPAPPQHSWGCHCHPQHGDSRGCLQACASTRIPCRKAAVSRPSSPLAQPFCHCPCTSQGVNYRRHVLEKEVHVLSELLCSCCSSWLWDYSSQPSRPLPCCYQWAINSPGRQCCADLAAKQRLSGSWSQYPQVQKCQTFSKKPGTLLHQGLGIWQWASKSCTKCCRLHAAAERMNWCSDGRKLSAILYGSKGRSCNRSPLQFGAAQVQCVESPKEFEIASRVFSSAVTKIVTTITLYLRASSLQGL